MLSLYIRLIGSGSVNRLLHQRQGIKEQLYENIDDKTCPFALKHKPFCPERITGEYGTIKYLLVKGDREPVCRLEQSPAKTHLWQHSGPVNWEEIFS
jgi:hypothetical protein